MLRALNVLNGHINLDNVVYVSLEKHKELKATEILPGDILITMRGTFGRAAIVPDSIPKANMNAALCRIRLEDKSLSEYIMWYLNSQVAYRQLKRHGTKAVQDDLNLGYIRALRVVLPNAPDRDQLLRKFKIAQAAYMSAFKQANEGPVKAKKHIFDFLGIHFSDYAPSIFSFHRLEDILDRGIQCNPHSAYLNEVFGQLRNSKWYAGHLEDFVDVNPRTDRAPLSEHSTVMFVPMTAVEEKTNHVVYETREYGEVKTGFTVFQKNDLLWAKITPCMQNGKSFFTSDMPADIGFASTEFHVLRQKSGRIYMPFLWVILSESHVLEAAQGMFSGSAGQQRVPDTFLKKFPIVLPPVEMQRELADAVFAALRRAKQMRESAESDWKAAKETFERALLEG